MPALVSRGQTRRTWWPSDTHDDNGGPDRHGSPPVAIIIRHVTPPPNRFKYRTAESPRRRARPWVHTFRYGTVVWIRDRRNGTWPDASSFSLSNDRRDEVRV